MPVRSKYTERINTKHMQEENPPLSTLNLTSQEKSFHLSLTIPHPDCIYFNKKHLSLSDRVVWVINHWKTCMSLWAGYHRLKTVIREWCWTNAAPWPVSSPQLWSALLHLWESRFPSLQVPLSGKMRYAKICILTISSKGQAVPTEAVFMPAVRLRSIEKYTKSQTSQESKWFKMGWWKC